MYWESMVDALLVHACSSGSGRTAVEDTEGKRLTYGELLGRALAAARVLAESYGLEPGGKVALAPVNNVESVVALYSCWLAGLTVAVVDPLSHSDDLLMQLEISRPSILLTTGGFLDAHAEAARRAGVAVYTIEQLYSRAAPGTAWEGYWRPRAWEPALIYFYAGIAGRTMEVIHTHSTVTASAVLTASHFSIGESDNILVTPPISHALGLQIATLAANAAAARATLYTKKGRLSPSRLLSDVGRASPTIIIGAPQLYSALLDAGAGSMKGLRFSISAGAPLPLRVKHAWEEKTGTPLLQLYGMTEAAPVSATLPNDNPDGSIGVPVPGVEVAVTDPEEPGRSIRREGVGELLVRGPVVMKGYGEEDETRNVMLRGWLRTGDIIEVREGHLYFRGVKKRMIKYKGYPIFPRDLELLLEKHPAVARAEVYGEPAGELGQVPVARVWLRRGRSASPEELMEWVNSRVAPYKRLRGVRIAGEEG
ncbi:MAG: acyl--CoA ligase [Crenarchaeota archaeon]|nr:acyl--CoA ligase [Thermoproteota archaeon]